MAHTTQPGPSPTEIQSVLSAWRILARWQLAHYPIWEAIAHLRASYGLRRKGLRDYVLAVMGKAAFQATQQFRLFAGVDGEDELLVPVECGEQRLVDYLVENFDQRSLPARVELRGLKQIFFL